MHVRAPSIEETAARVNRRFHNTAIDESLKAWANEQLREIQSDLDLVIRGDDGYEDFMLTFIGRERERYVADTAEGKPFESVREEPLCTCNDLGCELKRGKLPKPVRDAADIERGIRLFKLSHDGDPIVLDHEDEPLGARQKWSEKRGEVWNVLRDLQTYMVEHREDPPGVDEDPEPTEPQSRPEV